MRFSNLRTLAVIMVFALSTSVFAQTKAEAVEAYNNGASLMATDPKGAIAAFEECISISKDLGEEGEETLMNASKALPGLHYKVAMGAYKKKDFPTAIKEFTTAKELGEDPVYGNEEIAKKANKVIPQVYNISATNYYKTKEYDKALGCYSKATDYDENFSKAYYGQAVVYKKKGEIENMKAACDRAIETSRASKDRKSEASAKKLVRSTMYNEAVKAIGAEDWAKAESALQTSIEYGNQDPGVFYQLGKVYNTQKNYSEAVSQINKAIELDQEADSAGKAKYYFEIGNAYVGMGDNAAACEAFKNAMYGDYAANAKYQIEQVLKCN